MTSKVINGILLQARFKRKLEMYGRVQPKGVASFFFSRTIIRIHLKMYLFTFLYCIVYVWMIVYVFHQTTADFLSAPDGKTFSVVWQFI